MVCLSHVEVIFSPDIFLISNANVVMCSGVHLRVAVQGVAPACRGTFSCLGASGGSCVFQAPRELEAEL